MDSTTAIPPRLATTLAMAAAPSHGTITTSELRELGFTEDEVRTMVAHGWLIRIRRSVYVVGFLSTSDEARWARATRSYGDDAALDGMSAAFAWELARHEPRIVQVVAPTRHRPVAGTRLRLDGRMNPSWIERHRGVRLLTPTRTIVRVACFEREERVVAVMREAAYRRLLAMDELLAIVARERGRPGIANLVRALSLRVTGSAGERSVLELAVIDLLARLWPTPPAYNVRIGGSSRRYELDLSWAGVLIGCEIDGPIHDEPDVRRDDMKRDAELALLGWKVFRIHWRAFELDSVAAVTPLVRALAHAYGQPIPELPVSRNRAQGPVT